MNCIYIPIIEREIAHLEFLSYAWHLFPPFRKSFGESIDLIISFDKKPSISVEDQCQKFFSECGFSNIKIISANLSDDEAVYIRSPTDATLCPEFGYKSDPNLHWLFNQRFLAGRYQWALQNEVDMFPLEPYWFERCLAGLSEKWVISGAIYRGPTRLGPRIWNHINGNAFYRPVHELHRLWVDLTEVAIRSFVKQGKVGVAFDFATFEYFSLFHGSDTLKLFNSHNSVIDNEDILRVLVSSINYNDSIWNYSGGFELRPDYGVNFDLERARYGETALCVHSNAFRYWVLQELLLNEVRLNNSQKKFLIRYSKEELFPLDHKNIVFEKYVKTNKVLNWALSRSFLYPGLWSN